jgi:hypothetical protein
LLLYYFACTTDELRDVFDKYLVILKDTPDDYRSEKLIELLGGEEALEEIDTAWSRWILSLEPNDTPEEARTKAIKAKENFGK